MPKPPSTQWKDLDLRTRLICLVTYASVFNDVISQNELKRKLGGIDRADIDTAIHELVQEGLLINQEGYVGLPYQGHKITEKHIDTEVADNLIGRQMRFLRWIGKTPIIRFVGISGSLAARNPVANHEGIIDVDVFLITRSQTIWIVGILTAFYRMLVKGKHGHCCFNHVWDESDLKVYNRNLYTATEIFNLVPISGKETYDRFLKENSWASDYYPLETRPYEKSGSLSKSNTLNKILYTLFTLFRCAKNLSLMPLLELNFEPNPYRNQTLTRKGAENGGYQRMIQQKFSDHLKKYFPEMDTSELERCLFPDDLSRQIVQNAYKMPVSRDPKHSDMWALNYSKYK